MHTSRELSTRERSSLERGTAVSRGRHPGLGPPQPRRAAGGGAGVGLRGGGRDVRV